MSQSLSESQTSSSSSSSVSAELKLYQAFIFSVPIFFAFILVFMFYLFYLRRGRADWSSLRMRTSPGLDSADIPMSMAELGLKKEVREMLPIIIYRETFSIRDTHFVRLTIELVHMLVLPFVRTPMMLYEDKLQQIPACGHTFHMDCIDHWLANHSTCPLCRLSVLASPKAPDKLPIIPAANTQESSHPASSNGLAAQPLEQTIGDARHNGDEQGREFGNTRDETDEHEGSRGITGNLLLLNSLV